MKKVRFFRKGNKSLTWKLYNEPWSKSGDTVFIWRVMVYFVSSIRTSKEWKTLDPFWPFLWEVSLFFMIRNEKSFDFKHFLLKSVKKFFFVLEISVQERFRGRPFHSLTGPFKGSLNVAYCCIEYSRHILFYIAFQNISPFYNILLILDFEDKKSWSSNPKIP